MMVSLALLLLGNRVIIPVLAMSELVMALGILAFAVNIFLNITTKTL